MSANIWKASTVNAFTTTLNGGIAAGDSSITLASVTGLQAPGVLVVDRVDANNTATPTVREFISFTGIAGSAITGCTRGLGGSTGQSHNSGAKVEETFSISHWNDFLDAFAVSHDSSGNIVATSMATLTAARILTSIQASGASVTLGNVTIHGRINLSGASIATEANFGLNPGWFVSGGVSLATTSIGPSIPMPAAGSWRWFSMLLKTPASGASFLVDVNKNGVSIFDSGTRLYIAGGGTFVSTASIATKGFNAGDVFSIDADTGAGSGSGLTVLGRGM